LGTGESGETEGHPGGATAEETGDQTEGSDSMLRFHGRSFR
jgi:hypothetical protein